MLNIDQLDPAGAKRFVSTHSLHVQAQNGLELITLTGVVILEYKASVTPGRPGIQQGWDQEELNLNIALPESVTSGKALFVEQCAPFATINAIGGMSTVGWAVDKFTAETGIRASGAYAMRIGIGVFNTGEILHKIAYQVSLVGRFVD